MKTGARLALYGLGLVAAFGTAFVFAGAVIPGSVVAGWTEGTEMNGHDEGHDSGSAASDGAASNAAALKGLALEIDGFVLSPVQAPATVGAPGELSFRFRMPPARRSPSTRPLTIANCI